MKTKNMVYFGIFVAVLVITDCIAEIGRAHV